VSFWVTDRCGGDEREPSVGRLREVLAELEYDDPEHPDVSLTHESGWSLSASGSGLLVWENVETDAPPRHMRDVPRERVLQLWLRLARGWIDEIEREPWQPGYGGRAD
jgi:hypothetical protein